MIRTLAHLSDLHIGRSPAQDVEVERAVEAVEGIDHVIEIGRAHV